MQPSLRTWPVEIPAWKAPSLPQLLQLGVELPTPLGSVPEVVGRLRAPRAVVGVGKGRRHSRAVDFDPHHFILRDGAVQHAVRVDGENVGVIDTNPDTELSIQIHPEKAEGKSDFQKEVNKATCRSRAPRRTHERFSRAWPFRFHERIQRTRCLLFDLEEEASFETDRSQILSHWPSRRFPPSRIGILGNIR